MAHALAGPAVFHTSGINKVAPPSIAALARRCRRQRRPLPRARAGLPSAGVFPGRRRDQVDNSRRMECRPSADLRRRSRPPCPVCPEITDHRSRTEAGVVHAGPRAMLAQTTGKLFSRLG